MKKILLNQKLITKAKELIESGCGRDRISEILNISARQSMNLIKKIREEFPEIPPSSRGGMDLSSRLEEIKALSEEGKDTYDIAKRFSTSPTTINNSLKRIEGTYSPVNTWVTKASKFGILYSKLQETLKIKTLKRAEEVLKETFPNCYISHIKKGDDLLLTPIPDSSNEIEQIEIDTEKKKSLFTYYVNPFKNYMHVKFNDEIPGEELTILNLTDIHLGSKACRTELFKNALSLLDNPSVFGQIGGDVYENNTRQSAGNPFDQYLSPTEQVSFSGRMIAPVAHKIINYEEGNHEERTERWADFSSGAILAELLKLPYFAQGVVIDYEWRGVTITQYHTHRFGKASEDVVIKRKVKEYLSKVNFPIHIFSSGHTHDSFILKLEHTVKITGRGFEGINSYIVNGGSFTQDSGTYSERFGRSPKDLTGFTFNDSGEVKPISIEIKSL